MDLFCGAGGFDSGFVRLLTALGIEWVLKAVNHWHRALETHQLNHPGAQRYLKDLHALTEFDIQNLVWGPPGKKGRRKRPWLDILLASPTCVMHSQARGGLPILDQQRMDPWAILTWITALHGRVRRVLVENVPFFPKWGPLNEDGRPVKGMEGTTFRAFVGALEALGFRVEWRIICCADHGDPTTRERFFLQARKDGKPIRWPPESHRDPEESQVLSLFGDEPEPWRSAADHVIDWSDLGQSIIDRVRSLRPNTTRRIGTGAVRFGGAYAPVLDAVMQEVQYRAVLEDYWHYPVSLADLGDPRKNPATGYTARQLMAMVRTGRLPTTGKRPKSGARAKDIKTRRVHLPPPADSTQLIAWRAARQGLAEGGMRHPSRTLAFRCSGSRIVRVDDGSPAASLPPALEVVPGSYLLTMYGTGGGRSIHEPVPAFTSQGGHLGLVTPFVFPVNQGDGRIRGHRPVTLPLGTILTGESFGIGTPVIRAAHTLAPPEPYTCANRANNSPRRVTGPVCGATTSTGGGIFLGLPLLLGQHGGAHARPVSQPIPAVATDGAISVSFPMAFPAPCPAGAFLFCANHAGEGRFYLPQRAPVPTQTGKRGIALAMPSFWLQPFYSAYNARADAGAVPVSRPVPAATTRARFGFSGWQAAPWSAPRFVAGEYAAPCAGLLASATPWVISTRQLSPGYGPAPRSVFQPLPTLTGGGSQLALITPEVMDQPTPYLMGIDHASGAGQLRPVTSPVPGMVTKQSVAVLSPELRIADAFALDRSTPSFTEPLPPPTGRRVWVDDCVVYVDIRFRMLTNRELSRAMSFDDEEYEYVFAGSQEEVTRQLGNAVPVRTARALCGAMLWDVLEAHAQEPKAAAPATAAA